MIKAELEVQKKMDSLSAYTELMCLEESWLQSLFIFLFFYLFPLGVYGILNNVLYGEKNIHGVNFKLFCSWP